MTRFLLLFREALGDALRRRIVGGVAVAGLIAIAMLESCTGCTPSVHVNGEVRELAALRGPFGFTAVLFVGLWSIALAGVLAADHLRSTLDDGSAALSLARPIGREVFALARLAGALGVALIACAIVLGIATALLVTRASLPPGPALWAGASATLGAITVGALAMTASLFLPRAVTVLLVLIGVGVMALANGVTPLAENAGWISAVDRFGPPLASTLALALAPWLDGAHVPGDAVRLTAQLLAWAIGSVLVLLYAFRHIELGR